MRRLSKNDTGVLVQNDESGEYILFEEFQAELDKFIQTVQRDVQQLQQRHAKQEVWLRIYEAAIAGTPDTVHSSAEVADDCIKEFEARFMNGNDGTKQSSIIKPNFRVSNPM